MIFLNKSETVWWDIWNILFRVGEWCATNCYNCTSAFDKVSYKPYSDYKNIFEKVVDVCDDNLLVFFYWVEAIFHPEIEYFINDNNLKDYKKSLHITPLYRLDRIQKIKNISDKYNNISFDTCYTIKNTEDLFSFLKFFTFLNKNKINSTLDIFFDYNKYAKILLNFFKKFNPKIVNKPINTHLGNEKCIELNFDNNQIILLYHTKPQFIKDDKIHNLPFTLCAVKKSFDIKEDFIYTSEEIEFTENGDITVHFSTYCSKWIQKISSIYKNKKEIIEDFKKFDKYLEKYNSGDMWKNCYNCISNPYNNE